MQTNYLRVVLRWMWLLILIPVAAGVVGALYVSDQPAVYRAITRLIVGPGIDSPNPSLDSLRTGALLMQSYAELAKTESFGRQVLADVGLDIPVTDLPEIVSLRPIVDTQILNVVVEYSQTEQAVALANQIAEGLVSLSPSSDYNTLLRSRMQDQAERMEQSIVEAEQQLAELQTELEGTTDLLLQESLVRRVAELEGNLANTNAALAGLYDGLQRPFTNQVEIVDRAESAVEVSSPVALTVLIAVGAGALISVVLAVLLIFLDLRLVDYETLRKVDKVPVWGFVRQKKTVDLKDVQMLTAYVMHQNREHGTKCILLTGVENGTHVPSLAAALAVALAYSGEQVLLIDADFSNSAIGKRFASPNPVNLSDLLTKMPEKFEVPALKEYPKLSVIQSGERKADKHFLFTTPNLQQLLERFVGSPSYVLVAAPPLASFEQGVAIADWADADVVVARQGKTLITDLNKVLDYLESVGGKVRGLVVTS